MSLNVGDSRRGRDRSPGRYEEEVRERSRTRVEIDRAPSPPRSRYDDPRDSRRRYEYEEETVTRSSKGGPERKEARYTSTRKYASESESESSVSSVSPERPPRKPMPGEFTKTEEKVEVRYGDRRGKEYYEEKKYTKKDVYEPDSPKDRYAKPADYRYAEPDPRDRRTSRYEEEVSVRERGSSINVSGSFSVGKGDSPKKEYASFSMGRGDSPKKEYGRPASPQHEYGRPPSPKHDYGSPPSPKYSSSSYADPKKYEYAQPAEKITYTSRTETYSNRPSDPRSSDSKIVTVEPGQRRISGASSLQPRMGSLSVSTGHSQALTLAAAPGSPLLEAYHGTYQSISPMPSPMMVARRDADVKILDIGPLSPTNSKVRHARFHDSAADAAKLAKALSGSKSPNIDPLIEILPALTHEQVMNLRIEYKKLVKTGSERKGVNIAKHIKLRLKDEEPPLLKACYATALGQWESEAYWANFWYQGEKSRRELLIESLMGRTNAEIRAIKDGFSDKKYSDSLTKCMKMELKEDKFKKAVLLVLEEKRMEDRPYSIDRRLVEEDVRELYRAVKSEKGGETNMINIIVLRSDSHIREILKVYEASFKANFAREMLKKSGNLVVRSPPIRPSTHLLTSCRASC